MRNPKRCGNCGSYKEGRCRFGTADVALGSEVEACTSWSAQPAKSEQQVQDQRSTDERGSKMNDTNSKPMVDEKQQKKQTEMPCQRDRCRSDRILRVIAKCSDCCYAKLGEHEHDGYVPGDLGIGGGDYVELKVCLDCGQVQGSFPAPRNEEMGEV